MVKRIFGLIIILIVIITSVIIYNNYEDIVKYFQNKEWEIADSVGNVTANNALNYEGTLSNLIVIGNNYVKGYSSNTSENFDLVMSFQDVVSDSNGDYCIFAERNGSTAYMIYESTKIWENKVAGNINDVYVNKNGYVGIIFKQSGYKTLIKVLSPAGEEIFTSYFASTYALDISISNENKKLAIAELDTNGIKIVSTLKEIEINNLGEQNIKKYELPEDDLIIDIEYTEKNGLLVKTDTSVYKLENERLEKILQYDSKNTLFITIENKKYPVYVQKIENGLFDIKYKLCVYSYDEDIKTKEIELDDLPKTISVCDDSIAMIIDNELLIYNLNGKLVKRCEVSKNIKSLVFFNKGNSIGAILRDSIEFLKI